MRRIKAFGRFWWDFVVGDDWRAAAGVVIAIGATAALVAGGVDAWWLLPVAVATILWVSLRRETSDVTGNVRRAPGPRSRGALPRPRSRP